MKKVLHIFFTIIILISTSGLKLDAHFCHEKLVDIKIGQTTHDCCEKPCKHCKDEPVIISLDIDLINASHKSVQFSPFCYSELDVVKLITSFQAENPDKIVILQNKFRIPTKTRLAKLQRYLC